MGRKCFEKLPKLFHSLALLVCDGGTISSSPFVSKTSHNEFFSRGSLKVEILMKSILYELHNVRCHFFVCAREFMALGEATRDRELTVDS
jgi:hypothetical protein